MTLVRAIQRGLTEIRRRGLEPVRLWLTPADLLLFDEELSGLTLNATNSGRRRFMGCIVTQDQMTACSRVVAADGTAFVLRSLMSRD